MQLSGETAVVSRAIAAIEGAATMKEYEAAKRLAGRCHPACQLAMVDLFIDAKQRIKGNKEQA